MKYICFFFVLLFPIVGHSQYYIGLSRDKVVKYVYENFNRDPDIETITTEGDVDGYLISWKDNKGTSIKVICSEDKGVLYTFIYPRTDDMTVHFVSYFNDHYVKITNQSWKLSTDDGEILLVELIRYKKTDRDPHFYIHVEKSDD